MTPQPVSAALRSWLVLAVAVQAGVPFAVAILHWLRVNDRFGPAQALHHAAEYALLPASWAVLRLLAVATAITFPLHLAGIARRWRRAALAPAAVVGVVAYLGLTLAATDLPELYWGDLDAVALPPTATGLLGCFAGGLVAAALAGGILARGSQLLASPRVRTAVAAVAATYLTAVAVAAAGPYLLPSIAPSTAPNVLLVSMDTLRADHLGLYDYPRDTSPTIDRLGAEGVVFDNAITQAPWTLPAHLSLFSGLDPSQHGLTRFTTDRDSWAAVSPQIPLVAEIVEAHGYVTAAFTGGGFVDPAFGFARGFDMYRTDSERLEDFLPAVKRWLVRHRRTPFLLFLQFYNCHRPYAPPPDRVARFLPPGSTNPAGDVAGFCSAAESTGELPSQQLLDTIIAHYDGEISFADELLGEVFAVLAETGLGDRTRIVFLSDHGDAFFEHGNCDHIKSLYDPLLRVPLVVAGPGIPRGVRVAEVVELRDVAQLVLDLAGIEYRIGLSSGRLWELINRRVDADPTAVAFAETCCKGYDISDHGWLHRPSQQGIRSLQGTDFKLVTDNQGAPLELYDLRHDPGETVNLLHHGRPADDEAARALEDLHRALLDRINASDRDFSEPLQQKLDDEVADQLRSLGYLEE